MFHFFNEDFGGAGKMTALEKREMTVEEYLSLEKSSDIRFEFVDGEVFAMTGAKHNHSLISFNIAGELRNQIKGSGCKGFLETKRVKVVETGDFFYPDIVVACGDIEILEDELDTLTNPMVIIEILSSSTEAYDRGGKFERYKLIDSLQEYVLISQNHYQVERFKREKKTGIWDLTVFKTLSQALPLESIRCELPLSEIYFEVDVKKL